MDIRPLAGGYAVSPQIAPEDAPAIASAGFEIVVCNRPDAEVPPPLQAAAVRAAIEGVGLRFVEIPAPHALIDAAMAARQREAAAGGRALAYCASGTRCSVLWALGEAGHRPVDEILAVLARAGYDLQALRPQIEALAAR